MNMHDDEEEAAAREILARYRVGTWTIELEDGREPRMYADRTMLELLGVADAPPATPEALYHAWYDHVDPHHYDAVADGVDRMVNGCAAEIQYPWIHPVRGLMYVRCGAKRDFSCRDYVRLEGTHQDVTDLDHVQKESREDVIVREKLNVERRRYVMMCNLVKSSQWSFTYDAQGRMTSVLWSDEFRRILGYKDGSDFPNVLDSWKRLLHPEDAERALEQINAAVEDRTGQTPYDVRYRLRTRDRGWRWFNARGEISRTKEGIPIEFAGVMTDVDAEERNAQLTQDRLAALEEVKRTSAELAKALAEAKRAEQMEATFLATMSHEIRTPLNAVVGFAEFLRAGSCTDAEKKDYLDGILNSSNALLALINDVLDLSKIQAGMMPFRGGTCDLARLFGEIETIFRFNAAAKGIALRFAAPAQTPCVDLREERLRQILINLVGNAVKFTNAGEVACTAAVVRGADGDDVLEMTVRDTGVGIPAAALERIFEPFRQDGGARGGRVYQGTGLGLSICRRLLESVGGTISVDSREGAGSAFTVRIPHVRATAGVAPQTAKGKTQNADFALPDDFSVVAVDDVAINLVVLSKHLERLGVPQSAVRTFADAPSALAAIREKPPALVFTDLWMAGMNGEEFARALKQDDRLADVPVVAETADADVGATFDASLFDGILTKPLTATALQALFAKHFPVGGAGARRAGSRILVVDDVPTNRRVLCALLEQTGRICAEADGADAALAALAQGDVGCVLTDFAMPGKTGADLARAVKQDPRFAAVKVILLAGDEPCAADAGLFDAVLAKPATLDELQKTLARFEEKGNTTR